MQLIMHCVIWQKNCIRSYNTYLFTVTTRKCNALKHMTNSWSQYYNAFELVTIISEKTHYNVRLNIYIMHYTWRLQLKCHPKQNKIDQMHPKIMHNPWKFRCEGPQIKLDWSWSKSKCCIIYFLMFILFFSIKLLIYFFFMQK